MMWWYAPYATDIPVRRVELHHLGADEGGQQALPPQSTCNGAPLSRTARPAALAPCHVHILSGRILRARAAGKRGRRVVGHLSSTRRDGRWSAGWQSVRWWRDGRQRNGRRRDGRHGRRQLNLTLTLTLHPHDNSSKRMCKSDRHPSFDTKNRSYPEKPAQPLTIWLTCVRKPTLAFARRAQRD